MLDLRDAMSKASLIVTLSLTRVALAQHPQGWERFLADPSSKSSRSVVNDLLTTSAEPSLSQICSRLTTQPVGMENGAILAKILLVQGYTSEGASIVEWIRRNQPRNDELICLLGGFPCDSAVRWLEQEMIAEKSPQRRSHIVNTLARIGTAASVKLMWPLTVELLERHAKSRDLDPESRHLMVSLVLATTLVTPQLVNGADLPRVEDDELATAIRDLRNVAALRSGNKAKLTSVLGTRWATECNWLIDESTVARLRSLRLCALGEESCVFTAMQRAVQDQAGIRITLDDGLRGLAPELRRNGSHSLLLAGRPRASEVLALFSPMLWSPLTEETHWVVTEPGQITIMSRARAECVWRKLLQ